MGENGYHRVYTGHWPLRFRISPSRDNGTTCCPIAKSNDHSALNSIELWGKGGELYQALLEAAPPLPTLVNTLVFCRAMEIAHVLLIDLRKTGHRTNTTVNSSQPPVRQYQISTYIPVLVLLYAKYIKNEEYRVCGPRAVPVPLHCIRVALTS